MPLATRPSAPPEMLTSTPPAGAESTVTTKSVACTGKSWLSEILRRQVGGAAEAVGADADVDLLQRRAPGTLIGSAQRARDGARGVDRELPGRRRGRAPASMLAASVPESTLSPVPRKVALVILMGPSAWLTSICLRPSPRSRACVSCCDRSSARCMRLMRHCDGAAAAAAAVGAVARDGAGRRALANLQRRRSPARAPLGERRATTRSASRSTAAARRRQRRRDGGGRARLLRDVGQLVRDEALAPPATADRTCRRRSRRPRPA